MKKSRFIIPKGYKGIAKEIILEFNSQLAVITGLNGCGKSTILKYLFENYPDRSKCFIKTPQTIGIQQNDRRIASPRGTIRYAGDVSFDLVMEDIESLGLRRGRQDSSFADKTDFYSSLFYPNSIYYQNGYEYLESIAKLLADYQFDEIDNIKRILGTVTENDVEERLILELNQNKSENQKFYGVTNGKKIIDKEKNFELDNEQTKKLGFLRRKIHESLKIELRKKSKITSEQALKKYVFELVTKEFRSIESIVQKMSNKIYQDFKSKSSRTKTKKLWEEINDELKKYNSKGYFKYKLVPPQIFESNYEIAFEHYDNSSISYVHFDSLSSGEKIIFELICYYFASKESKLEMIMLDEFDANLNPILAEQYIEVIREQFKDIKVLLTTHSPSTVVEVKPVELFELTDSRELKCANSEDGKSEILKRLAPKFVYHGEFGILEDVFNQRYEMIIFTEGMNDVKNFHSVQDVNKYKFIASNGAGNMNNLISVFKAIPFFYSLAKDKIIVFLYDFDNEGLKKLSEHLPKSTNNQEVFNKINKKESFIYKIDKELQIFVSHLLPSAEHSWNIKDEYRHQELKQEGENGIKRQYNHLKSIIESNFN